MELVVIAVAALAASLLTFFSGFGLATILTPVVALFLPIDLAVAATALVHLVNNVLKVALLGRRANPGIMRRFGLPAIAAAFLGAWLLGRLASASGGHSMATYPLILGRVASITWLGLVLGSLMIAFAALELSPRFARLTFPPTALPLGGLLSGFFGGLSGHQGALRSAFLVRAGLDKASLVATGAVISLGVDLVRLLTYSFIGNGAKWHTLWSNASTHGGSPSRSIGPVLAVAIAAALAGTLLGQRFLEKTTIQGVRRIVGIALLILGAAIASGLV